MSSKAANRSSSTMVVVLTVVVALALCTKAVNAGVLERDERAITNSGSEVSFCASSTPCGWAIYTPFVRRLDYLVRNNSCKCASNLKCIRDADDVSISAYVYHCLPEKQPSQSDSTS